MKRRKILFIAAAMCVIFTAGFGVRAEAGSFGDLQKIVKEAAPGSVLVLSEDYTYDLSTDAAMPTEGITVDKAITIDGAGHTIDAIGAVRVFTVAADNAAFKNLTITKGGSTVSGGGVYVNQSLSASFEKVKIIKCGSEKGVHTKDGGAALFVDSKAQVTFTDCEISDNVGKDRAGGIYMRGNAVFKNTKIMNNTGGSRGGGIYVDPGYKAPNRGGEWGGNIKMYNCTIMGNKGGRGGGIYVNAENETLNIFENCTISSNDVSANSIGNGGGILFYNANGKLVNCTITGNRAKNGGGVILDVASKLELVSCTIASNVATVGGAGLYAHDGSHPEDTMKAVGTANFMGCVIVGNKLGTGAPQDISVHYSDNADKETKPELGPWVARYDGNFKSGGYNVLGTVDLAKPENVSLDVNITLDASDLKDQAANSVLNYDGESPALADNGGYVPTVALAEKSPALYFIPAGTSWLPATDARGISRRNGAKNDAGAYGDKTGDSSSGGCSAASFPLILLAFGALTMIYKKR